MKITFHYSYILIAIGFILTGYFSNLIIFTSIILIHELGHIIIAKINNLKVETLTIYPYGGLIIMNNPINTKISKELITAISGVIFQEIYFIIILFLYKKGIIRDYIYQIYKMYNYNIIYFNLLPIIPLDGSKIINLLLSYYLPYKKTQYITIIISIITIILIFITNIYTYNYTLIMILILIVTNIIKYYKNINYLFNKFLLERFLNNYHYKKRKNIKKINDMYLEKKHLIKSKYGYITEKEALNKRFKRKN